MHLNFPDYRITSECHFDRRGLLLQLVQEEKNVTFPLKNANGRRIIVNFIFDLDQGNAAGMAV